MSTEKEQLSHKGFFEGIEDKISQTLSNAVSDFTKAAGAPIKVADAMEIAPDGSQFGPVSDSVCSAWSTRTGGSCQHIDGTDYN